MNVSERLVSVAKHVLEHGTPQLVDAVKAGSVAVSAAEELANLPEKEQQAIVAEGAPAVRKKVKELRERKQHAPRGADGRRNTPSALRFERRTQTSAVARQLFDFFGSARAAAIQVALRKLIDAESVTGNAETSEQQKDCAAQPAA